MIEFATRAGIDVKSIRGPIEAAAKAKADAKKKAADKKATAAKAKEKAVPLTVVSPAANPPAKKNKKAKKASTKTMKAPATEQPAKKVDAAAAPSELHVGPPDDKKTLPIDAGKWPFPTSSTSARPTAEVAK